MANPVISPVNVAPPVSGLPGEADKLTSSAAVGADAVADFAALLLAQVTVQAAPSDAPAPATDLVAAPVDNAGADNPTVGATTTDLASLLGAVVLPTDGRQATATLTTTGKKAGDDLLDYVVLPTDTRSAAAPDGKPAATLPEIDWSSGKARSSLLQTIDSARQQAAAAGDDARLAGEFFAALQNTTADGKSPPGVDTVAAKIADSAIKLPVAITASAPDVGSSTPATSAGLLPLHHANPVDRSTGLPTVRLDTPLGDARWAGDFGQRIVWMARQDMQVAQLSINPPNLGPLDVSLNLGRDQATAVFSSPHAEVREALESALPRLREMLAGAGISLGQTQINSQSQQQSGQPNHKGSGSVADASDRSILTVGSDVKLLHTTWQRQGVGLVDTFA